MLNRSMVIPGIFLSLLLSTCLGAVIRKPTETELEQNHGPDGLLQTRTDNQLFWWQPGDHFTVPAQALFLHDKTGDLVRTIASGNVNIFCVAPVATSTQWIAVAAYDLGTQFDSTRIEDMLRFEGLDYSGHKWLYPGTINARHIDPASRQQSTMDKTKATDLGKTSMFNDLTPLVPGWVYPIYPGPHQWQGKDGAYVTAPQSVAKYVLFLGPGVSGDMLTALIDPNPEASSTVLRYAAKKIRLALPGTIYVPASINMDYIECERGEKQVSSKLAEAVLSVFNKAPWESRERKRVLEVDENPCPSPKRARLDASPVPGAFYEVPSKFVKLLRTSGTMEVTRKARAWTVIHLSGDTYVARTPTRPKIEYVVLPGDLYDLPDWQLTPATIVDTSKFKLDEDDNAMKPEVLVLLTTEANTAIAMWTACDGEETSGAASQPSTGEK